MAASLSEDRGKSYYSILGVDSSASFCEIRTAYKKLAMRWHPDKHLGLNWEEANVKFQEIQEAYAVLSDERKRALYDNGLYSADDDEEDFEGLGSFLNEMAQMMREAKDSQKARGADSFEDLQRLFFNMFSADLASINCHLSSASPNFDKKRGWDTFDHIGSIYNGAFFSSGVQCFNGYTEHGNGNGNGSSKKKKRR